MGEQRLVGGDDMLAGSERRLDGLLGDALLTADQLDEHIDGGIGGKRHRVLDEAEARQVGVALLVTVSRRDGHDLDGTARARGEVALARRQEPQQAAADRSEERRVGKEGRYGWVACREQTKGGYR